jgi:hypothetical protein
MQTHNAQLLEIAVQTFDDFLRVGNKLALRFVHAVSSLS